MIEVRPGSNALWQFGRLKWLGRKRLFESNVELNSVEPNCYIHKFSTAKKEVNNLPVALDTRLWNGRKITCPEQDCCTELLQQTSNKSGLLGQRFIKIRVWFDSSRDRRLTRSRSLGVLYSWQGVKNASAAPLKSVEFNWVKSRSSLEPNWVRLMRSRAYDPGLRDFDLRLPSWGAFSLGNYCSNSTIMINSV